MCPLSMPLSMPLSTPLRIDRFITVQKRLYFKKKIERKCSAIFFVQVPVAVICAHKNPIQIAPDCYLSGTLKLCEQRFLWTPSDAPDRPSAAHRPKISTGCTCEAPPGPVTIYSSMAPPAATLISVISCRMLRVNF